MREFHRSLTRTQPLYSQKESKSFNILVELCNSFVTLILFPSLVKTRPSHTAATPAATPPLPDAAVPPGGGGAAPVSSAKDKDRGGPSGSAAGTDALPQAMGKGSAPAAAETKGSNRSGGSELWIVGRVLEDMDTRLGAKQEKIRTLRDL